MEGWVDLGVGQWRIQDLARGHGERAKREPITGVWGQSPQRGPGTEPLVGSEGGEASLKLKHFCFWMFNGNRKFAHFSEIWKRKRPSNIVEFYNSCWKMAKNAPFHIKSPVKNFHGRAKGGASHHAPPNTPLVSVIYRDSYRLSSSHLNHWILPKSRKTGCMHRIQFCHTLSILRALNSGKLLAKIW